MVVAALGVLGLCLGSFVHALVWRLHELDKQGLSQKQKRKLSMWNGRSMCPHCRHELAWYDLLPVLSWLSLGGRCRYCRQKIDDSPFVELIIASLFIGSYAVWPFMWDGWGYVLFGFWLIFMVGFMALIVYDLRWMELPNKIVYPLIGLAVAHVLVLMFIGSPLRVLGDAVWGFVGIGGLFYALFQISGGRWIGGGDVKLGFMIGLLVGGPLNSLMVVFLAALGGTIVSLPLMALNLIKPNSRVPFGPFLLVATIIVYLFSESISDWYIGTFL